MLTPAFRILHSRDFPCLLCLVCNRISHHPTDVELRFCSACRLFLEDLPDDFPQHHTTEGLAPGLLLSGADEETCS